MNNESRVLSIERISPNQEGKPYIITGSNGVNQALSLADMLSFCDLMRKKIIVELEKHRQQL